METKAKHIPIPLLFIGGLCFVGGVWFLWCAQLKAEWNADEKKMPLLGVFGDSFGSLNTLFSGLAFVGVLVALSKAHNDSLDAEQRRREDKQEEDTRRLETEERHNEGIVAQERIALIHASTTLLTVKRDRLKSLERDYKELKELGRRFSTWCATQDVTPQYHQLSLKTLLSNSSSRGDEELRSMIAAILGARALDFPYGAGKESLKETISKRLLKVGDARLINRTQVSALEKKLEQMSGFSVMPKKPDEYPAAE